MYTIVPRINELETRVAALEDGRRAASPEVVALKAQVRWNEFTTVKAIHHAWFEFFPSSLVRPPLLQRLTSIGCSSSTP